MDERERPSISPDFKGKGVFWGFWGTSDTKINMLILELIHDIHAIRLSSGSCDAERWPYPSPTSQLTARYTFPIMRSSLDPDDEEVSSSMIGAAT